MMGSQKGERNPAELLVIFLSMVLGLTVVMSPMLIQGGYQFANIDSLFYITSFIASLRFGTPLDLQTFAFGQSFGTFQLPAALHPFWWVYWTTQSVPASYLFGQAVLFLGILAYAYALTRAIYTSILIATAGAAIFYVPIVLVDYFGTIMPQHITQIGIAYFGMALLLGPGRRSVVAVLAGFAVILAIVVMDWLYAVFIAPLVIVNLAAFAALLVRQGWPSAAPRAAAAVGCIVAIAALSATSGILADLNAFSLMAERMWTSAPVTPEIRRSLLIYGGVVKFANAQVFACLALLAALYLAFRRSVPLAAMGGLVIALVAAMIVLDLDSAGPNTYWTLPAVGYFERPLIPLYVVFIAAAARDLAGVMLRRSRSRPAADRNASDIPLPAAGLLAVAVASVPVAALLAFAVAAPAGGWRELLFRPPHYWPKPEAFAKALPLPAYRPPSFAPYVFDATSRHDVIHCLHFSHDRNPSRLRYCAYMMNRYSSPVFYEFQNLIDIQNLQMFDQGYRLGKRIEDPQGDHERTRLAFKSLGVRFVAVDGARDGALARLPIDGKEVSLLDLGEIGAADLSVRGVEFKPTYRSGEAIAARLERTAIVHDRAQFNRIGLLAPVAEFQLTYGAGRVSVRARTAGESVLLLPFQYSNCLALADAPDGAALLRVNGAQAALHFRGSVTISIRNRFTLFGDIGCRHRDFADVFRLGIWPRNTFEEIVGARRVPTVMRWYLESRLRYRDRVAPPPAKP